MKLSSFLMPAFTADRCLLCTASLSSGPRRGFPVCSSCFKALTNDIPENRCSVCSIPVTSENGTCMRCRTANYTFTSNFSLFTYRGRIKELIFQYKFRYTKSLAVLFAELLYLHYLKSNRPELIIPVPSTLSNVRRRGWDHVGEIAKILERRYSQPVKNCLKRKGSGSQKKLGFEGRLTNLDGKSRIRRECPETESSVLLLDDVFTTGATIEQCAKVLASAGYSNIKALTLAID